MEPKYRNVYDWHRALFARELSLPGTFSPRIIWRLFIVLQCIHLSLYCDAGERLLKQINLRIRSTIVFLLEYLENPKIDPYDPIFFVHYSYLPPLSHGPSMSSPHC